MADAAPQPAAIADDWKVRQGAHPLFTDCRHRAHGLADGDNRGGWRLAIAPEPQAACPNESGDGYIT